MKFTTAVLCIAAVASSTVMAAHPDAPSPSIIKCHVWDGHCLPGTDYNDNHEIRCKNRTESTMACVDLCCTPHGVATPTPKPSSIIKCKEWDGHCRRGMDYDEKEEHTRCKTWTGSTMACVDLCCMKHEKPTPSPSAKPPSIVKCKEWTGHCRKGMKYDRHEKDTRCKPRESSSMACVDECCKPHAAPTPSATPSKSAKPSSIIKCKEWDGHCRHGMDYNKKEEHTRCKKWNGSTMACVDLCCKAHVAPTPSPTTKPPLSIVKCKEWIGHCRKGMDYDHSEAHTRCKPRESSSMACVDECCKGHVVPTPTPSVKPPSIVMCKEWVGTWGGVCPTGSHYDQHMDETRCKGRTSSTMACVDECCKHD